MEIVLVGKKIVENLFKIIEKKPKKFIVDKFNGERCN